MSSFKFPNNAFETAECWYIVGLTAISRLLICLSLYFFNL